MRKVGWQWPALAVALLVTGVLLSRIEWVEITRDAGPTAEALRNPFLAADHFLERLGVRVERERRFREIGNLLTPDDALVMTESRATLSAAHVDDLLAWVEEGGQIVAQAVDAYDAQAGASFDPLLDRLGIRLVAEDVWEEQLDPQVADLVGTVLDDEVKCGLNGPASSLRVDDVELRAQFSSDRFLEADGTVVGSAGNDTGAQLLQVELGAGMVTVLTTTGMWRNTGIGCHDHAHLLGVLLGNAATVWWVAGVEMPALYTLIWRHFHYAVIGAALAVLLWAWQRAFRFTAARPERSGIRRSLLEHVAATGAFYWRHGRGDALLEFLREDVLSRAGGAEAPALAAAARRAGVDPAHVQRALSVGGDPGREEFFRRVWVLQQLRRVL